MDKEKLKTATKYCSRILITAVVVFMAFVFIGGECNYKPALEIQEYFAQRWGFTVTAGALSAVFVLWKMLNSSKDNKDNVGSIVEETQTCLQATNATNENLNATAEQLIDKYNQIMVYINNMTNSMNTVNEREKMVEDILVYFVMKGEDSDNINELKTLLGQSKLMEKAKQLRETFDLDQDGNVTAEEVSKIVKENPKVLEPIAKTINNAVQAIKRKKIE